MSSKPGERRLVILHAIAAMLEQPAGDKITTAALAARLKLSEAALYRHFASKAQMFEGLIEFIESSLFALLNQIAEGEPDALRQLALSLHGLLRFAQKNRGLTRVLTGDALVHENPRLQTRINQLQGRIEASLRQTLRIAATQGHVPAEHDFAAHAALLMACLLGAWTRFVKSAFQDDPLTHWETQWPLLSAPLQAQVSAS